MSLNNTKGLMFMANKALFIWLNNINMNDDVSLWKVRCVQSLTLTQPIYAVGALDLCAFGYCDKLGLSTG